jgi:hypothetical protein
MGYLAWFLIGSGVVLILFVLMLACKTALTLRSVEKEKEKFIEVLGSGPKISMQELEEGSKKIRKIMEDVGMTADEASESIEEFARAWGKLEEK